MHVPCTMPKVTSISEWIHGLSALPFDVVHSMLIFIAEHVCGRPGTINLKSAGRSCNRAMRCHPTISFPIWAGMH